MILPFACGERRSKIEIVSFPAIEIIPNDEDYIKMKSELHKSSIIFVYEEFKSFKIVSNKVTLKTLKDYTGIFYIVEMQYRLF